MSCGKLFFGPVFRVAVAVPMRQVFDFLPVDKNSIDIKPGTRLLIPFGKKKQVGLLLETAADSEFPAHKLKKVIECLDSEPVLANDVLRLMRWASDYYHHPVGEVMFSALPALLRQPNGISSDPVEPAGEKRWCVTQLGKDAKASEFKRAPRQWEVIALLKNRPDGMGGEELQQSLPDVRSVLKRLQDKSLVASHWQAPTDKPTSDAESAIPAIALNNDQQQAVDSISRSLDTFSVHVIEGVTGSGKTEVYLTLIERMIAQGRQSLVLVPEINLTPQLLQRFQVRFEKPIVVMHSQLTDRQRFNAWLQVRNGDADVVIGTRSAITTPMPQLGLIVVDEEHDTSFKQQDGFRYSARDLAVMRASILGIPVLLGSATPSLETLHNVYQKKYHGIRLRSRYGEAIHPTTQIVDIRSQPLSHGLSAMLLDQMKHHVSQGNQVLLFINRRGYAPTYMCHHCGWLAKCGRCDSHMTYHQSRALLRCHHCASERKAESACPDCGKEEMISLGEGTERIESAVNDVLPGVNVVRVDRDTTRRKGAMENILSDIHSGQAQVLIGTQMLAKGHHFPDVTLVGIINVDQGLFSVDFRAMEKTAQLIVQVAGRAGRAEKPGHVVIQTHFPEHPLLQTLVSAGYGAFARQTLLEREAAMLPPYSYMALVRAEAIDSSLPMQFLSEIRDLPVVSAASQVQLLGPLPSPMERRAGRYRAQLFIQANQRSSLHTFLHDWLPQVEQMKTARKVRWSVDVDPADIY